MGARKIKKKRSSRPQYTYPVAETDFLSAWRFDRYWSDEQTTALYAMIFKHGFMENARVLARAVSGGYIMLASFLDAESRDRAVLNIRAAGTNVIDTECPVPETRAQGFEPPALVFPKHITDAMTKRMGGDRILNEHMQEQIARRMDLSNGEEDFVVPDLSAEDYRKVQKRLKEKPQ
jgi:hypothetical protein